MASKAQRAAVRSRADKANAAIGSFCKVKTILPLSLGLVEANPAPKVGEPFQIEVSDRDLAYETAIRNLESGHTASSLNKHDLRETTQDIIDSIPQNDECGDPADDPLD